MTELAKAKLTELNASNAPVGQPIEVQFNPASLRMQLSNRSSGGAQAGSPTRQRAGEGSTSLSFDLQFDTADEGSADAPVSVLKRTAPVERFVRPRGTGPGQEAPPRVQFEWGSVKLQGVMESLSLDLDLFAFDGTPLRARCSVQMKGQDSAYALAPQGAGAGGAAAGAAGAVNGVAQALGHAAAGALGALASVGSVLRALDGESLPQLASRAGRDPQAWRELASSGAGNPQQLPAGQQVGVPVRSAGSPGVGGSASSGAAAGATSAATAAAPANSPGSPAALTRGGGLGATQAQAQDQAHTQEAARRLEGFGLAASPAPAPAAPRSTSATATARPTPPRPQPVALPPDRPFGVGLPLKPRRAVAEAASAGASGGRAHASRYRPCGCGCGGGCGCGR
jgi:hypothetical protein